MGKASRRKRERRQREEARRTFNGSQIRLRVGEEEVLGSLLSVQYAPPSTGKSSIALYNALRATPRPDLVQELAEVRQELARAKAEVEDLKAVLGDALEERGQPRSPMLARLGKVNDIERALQQVYNVGVGGYPESGSLFWREPERVCCSAYRDSVWVGLGPRHNDDCPLQEMLVAIGGRKEIERQTRMKENSKNPPRHHNGAVIVSPQQYQAYLRLFGEDGVRGLGVRSAGDLIEFEVQRGPVQFDTEYHPTAEEFRQALQPTGVPPAEETQNDG